MSRTIQDIQKEYQQAALELGAETYKLHALEQEVEAANRSSDKLKSKMLHLNKEANKLQQKQPEQPIEAEVVSDEQPQS